MSEPRKNRIKVDSGIAQEDEQETVEEEADIAHDIEYLETDGEFMRLNQIDGMETDRGEETEEHWDQNDIRILLNLYLQNVEKFRNPKVRKKNVWTDISSVVGKPPDTCDKKFRNLKITYIRLLRKRNLYGATSFKWPYFDIFEEIFCVDGNYLPEIQQKIQRPGDKIAKAFVSLKTSSSRLSPEIQENGIENREAEETKQKLVRRRYAEFRKVSMEMKDRQLIVEAKLDKLISIVEESNNIQRERNKLFEEYLEKMRRNM